MDTGVLFTLQLDTDTFIDPNGDLLTITTSELPSWLSFNTKKMLFTGVPNSYNNYTIMVKAVDNWGASSNVSFTIYTGVIYTYGPLVGTLLVD